MRRIPGFEILPFTPFLLATLPGAGIMIWNIK
jgi:hypothetical protein